MPVTYIPSPGERLLDAAVGLLQVSPEAAVAARREIEQIVKRFADSLKEAGASPGIAEARQALSDMADEAEALGQRFRQNMDKLVFGAPNFNMADLPEAEAAKRQEIASLKDIVWSEAAQLDEIADRLRQRRDQWAGKHTGELHAYEMAFGNPKKQLAVDAARLFFQHRPVDLHAGRKGDFYLLVEYLFELGSEHVPEGDELLRHVQEAVAAIQAAQAEQ